MLAGRCGSQPPCDPALAAARAFIRYYAQADGEAVEETARLVDQLDPAVQDQCSPFDPMLTYLTLARLAERFDEESRVDAVARTRAATHGLAHALVALDLSRLDTLLRRARLADAAQLLDRLERGTEVEPFRATRRRAGRRGPVRGAVGRGRADRLPAMWPRMIALAGCAGIAATIGDTGAAERLYTQAVRLPVPLPLERARVLLAFGQWLRRTNRPLLARPRLAEALSTAEAAGADGLAAQAAAELHIAGGRRRTRRSAEAELTAQEARIAGLAAQGLTTKEIAQQLSLSTKTVETHLTHIYRKLGVGSKRELRARRHPLLNQDGAMTSTVGK